MPILCPVCDAEFATTGGLNLNLTKQISCQQAFHMETNIPQQINVPTPAIGTKRNVQSSSSLVKKTM